LPALLIGLAQRLRAFTEKEDEVLHRRIGLSVDWRSGCKRCDERHGVGRPSGTGSVAGNAWFAPAKERALAQTSNAPPSDGNQVALGASNDSSIARPARAL
jgi:hypothetical protein